MRDALDAEKPWVIVLAAGEGRRIGALTTNASGVAVPKQYCSFGRSSSMLRWALDRARGIAPPERIVTIVAAEHRAWWETELASCAPANVLIQPRNRGTAAGILLPLIDILGRDSGATVVVIASDHYVEDERTLQVALERAVAAVRAEPDHLVLLGVEPDSADEDYGWILPGGPRGTATRAVARFVEKPSARVAAELLQEGAVWNSFLFAVRGKTLLHGFGRALPEVVEPFLRELVVLPRLGGLEELYRRLPLNDFSHDVLERIPRCLRLLKVPACGWTDLGTPPRLRRFLDAAPRPLNVR